ncbi:MAG: bifunctional phosphoribosylaminoimidazolecarboxamide formyltransferase/IMP cyclohydrolase [Synechococcales cyanobacterium RM1_1_8]|nr:bifunctional phosphoribosylaminoimidazolecarboxamide formyltransferase/IMP cyclohydrolase [Synechococcales cyanobacterium RM1_1_8]
MAKLALLSVSDKTGLEAFAQRLVDDFGYSLISSGGTAKALQAAGIPVTKVSDYTQSPEILGGRVKTLHPKIHGGILARPDEAADQADLSANDIQPIDLVVVNLYPFEQTVAQAGVTLAEAIEKIDIGGPTMVRSAAKNNKYVSILCKPSQYDDYLAELADNGGSATQAARQRYALAAFEHTAAYDKAIVGYLSQQPLSQQDADGSASSSWAMEGSVVSTLRYGENPHQKATWYQTGASSSGWAAGKILQGKELSYNNLVDLEAARQIIAEFAGADQPAAAAVLKHNNPCGVALGDSLVEAYKAAYAGDSTSAFGGIVAINRPLDAATAEEMTKTFLECIVTPHCTEEAKAVLTKKKNLRVLEMADLLTGPKETVKAIAGGFLVQDADDIVAVTDAWNIVTEAKPDAALRSELLFAWKVVRHVKSNAIVVTHNRATLGIGAGQMNRVGAAKIALEQAGEGTKGAVLASDGFFPFDDSVRNAAAAGIKAIVQPGGSMRDQDSIDAANELGIVMVMTGVRHFLH